MIFPNTISQLVNINLGLTSDAKKVDADYKRFETYDFI
jgi:hypothetical protein